MQNKTLTPKTQKAVVGESQTHSKGLQPVSVLERGPLRAAACPEEGAFTVTCQTAGKLKAMGAKSTQELPTQCH